MDRWSLKIELVDEKTKVKKTKSLAVVESVWVATDAALAMGILMAGKDENIHTIRIPVFTLGISANQEKADRLFRLLSDLFSNIFPDWPDARGWPMSSLKEAWNIHPLVAKKMPTDPNDLIIKKNFGGITSATFGVPPDIVVYTITARDGGACHRRGLDASRQTARMSSSELRASSSSTPWLLRGMFYCAVMRHRGAHLAAHSQEATAIDHGSSFRGLSPGRRPGRSGARYPVVCFGVICSPTPADGPHAKPQW
jgi:hypothetical protein